MTRLRRLVAVAILLAPLPLVAQQRSYTLAEAISQAQANGNQARAAEANRDAALLRNRQFYSRLLPQLSLSGVVPSINRSISEVQQPDGTSLFRPRDQTNANLALELSQKIPFTGGDLFVSSNLARVKVSGESGFETWSSTPYTIGIRQQIFRPNTLKWDREEQAIQGDLADRRYLEAREDVAVTVTGLFFDVYAARKQLENATKNAAVNDTLYRLNEGRFQVGKIGENDLLQSELALLRARASADDSRLAFDRALAALRTALNLPVGAGIGVEVTDDLPPTLDVDTTRAVAAALRNGSSVQQAHLTEVQAERSVNQARLADGVGATLQASYGRNSSGTDFSSAYDQLRESRQLSLSVQVPIWQWGAHGEGVAAARADQERIESQADETIRQTRQDAHFAVLQLEQARRNLTISAKADTVAGKRYEVAYNRYLIGRIDIDNLYLAQNEKDQANVSYAQALRGYWQAYYRLRRLTLVDFATGQPIR
jgi:outer membrane protein TolC